MSLVVVAHHSIATTGQHPQSTLWAVARQAWGRCPITPVVRPCPLSGAGAIHCYCGAHAHDVVNSDPCVVHCCCLLDQLSESQVLGCLSLWSWDHLPYLVSYHLLSLFIVVTLISDPCCLLFCPLYLFPVDCCPAIHPASRGFQQWHKVGYGLLYNIFETPKNIHWAQTMSIIIWAHFWYDVACLQSGESFSGVVIAVVSGLWVLQVLTK